MVGIRGRLILNPFSWIFTLIFKLCENTAEFGVMFRTSACLLLETEAQDLDPVAPYRPTGFPSSLNQIF